MYDIYRKFFRYLDVGEPILPKFDCKIFSCAKLKYFEPKHIYETKISWTKIFSTKKNLELDYIRPINDVLNDEPKKNLQLLKSFKKGNFYSARIVSKTTITIIAQAQFSFTVSRYKHENM